MMELAIKTKTAESRMGSHNAARKCIENLLNWKQMVKLGERLSREGEAVKHLDDGETEGSSAVHLIHYTDNVDRFQHTNPARGTLVMRCNDLERTFFFGKRRTIQRIRDDDVTIENSGVEFSERKENDVAVGGFGSD